MPVSRWFIAVWRVQEPEQLPFWRFVADGYSTTYLASSRSRRERDEQWTWMTDTRPPEKKSHASHHMDHQLGVVIRGGRFMKAPRWIRAAVEIWSGGLLTRGRRAVAPLGHSSAPAPPLSRVCSPPQSRHIGPEAHADHLAAKSANEN
ncbi:unnamed protein product [Diplocarpon coronariae]